MNSREFFIEPPYALDRSRFPAEQPLVVFFDEKGREIIKVDSVVRLYRLQGVLEYVLCKGYIDTPSFQRWRRLWKR
jgi:hypothetical protein